jgi:hypothetical protein
MGVRVPPEWLFTMGRNMQFVFGTLNHCALLTPLKQEQLLQTCNKVSEKACLGIGVKSQSLIPESVTWQGPPERLVAIDQKITSSAF